MDRGQWAGRVRAVVLVRRLAKEASGAALGRGGTRNAAAGAHAAVLAERHTIEALRPPTTPRPQTPRDMSPQGQTPRDMSPQGRAM